MFVSEAGVVTNHHFNPLHTDKIFMFTQGAYNLELVAKVFGKDALVSLWNIALEMPDAFGRSIARETAVFFSWSPEKRLYIGTIERRSRFMSHLSDPQS